MGFTSKTRGEDFCPECGEVVKWVRLISGMWIMVQEAPVMYIPGDGKMWLIDGKWDAVILKDCLIYKAFNGMDRSKIKKAYEPHVFKCGSNRKRQRG